MTLDEFQQSLTATEPPAGLTLALAGLWWDGKGDWTRAHKLAQQDEGESFTQYGERGVNRLVESAFHRTFYHRVVVRSSTSGDRPTA